MEKFEGCRPVVRMLGRHLLRFVDSRHFANAEYHHPGFLNNSGAMKDGPQAVEEFTTHGELRGPLRRGGYLFFVDPTRPETRAEQELRERVREDERKGYN
eukprot:12669740-Alexandrium_andersonii.AAC.1